MCHDADSRPPAPPRSGDVAERGTLTLTSADGTAVAAAYAAPAGEARVGVVLLPDVRGLHPYYVALAERFAEAGLPALAVDWFGRTAGLPERAPAARTSTGGRTSRRSPRPAWTPTSRRRSRTCGSAPVRTCPW